MSESEIVPVLTIDGPGGSGKGTICRLVAAKLGWSLLDSGALYRLVALAADNHRINTDQEPQLADLARNLDIRFSGGDREVEVAVFLDGQDVSTTIRTEAIGNRASQVAALNDVRQALLERQRVFAVGVKGLVADGRDMGSVVFPEAPYKVFLDASVDERAKRRYKQLIAKGLSANLDGLAREIAERDERDRNRSVAPLIATADMNCIDSTSMSIDAVVQTVLDLVPGRLLA